MRISKSLQQKIDRVVKENVDIVPYNSKWPKLFNQESKFLKSKFPKIIRRVEHFGSTAVPGLSAKPIVDLLVEVKSLKEVKQKIAPVLESLGYDYFWRPEIDKPPMYAWFIKRNLKGTRTHHIHMVEANSKLWDRLYFRDYLINHPQEAKNYNKLKKNLSDKYHNDRVAYTKAKTKFIISLTKKAKQYYQSLK